MVQTTGAIPMENSEILQSLRGTKVNFVVQRNGVTDRVTVGMGEELDVNSADSIEIIGVEIEVEE